MIMVRKTVFILFYGQVESFSHIDIVALLLSFWESSLIVHLDHITSRWHIEWGHLSIQWNDSKYIILSIVNHANETIMKYQKIKCNLLLFTLQLVVSRQWCSMIVMSLQGFHLCSRYDEEWHTIVGYPLCALNV